MNRAEIQKLINTAPSSWKKMFARYKLGSKPTVKQLIDTVLEYTPSMRSSGEKGEAKYVVPKKVKKEAWEGLVLSWKNNYTSASGIGLVRAMQLIVQPKIWERSISRMDSYFARSGKDTPKRYMAWLNWGGDSGKAWAKKMIAKRNPKTAWDKKSRKGSKVQTIMFSRDHFDGNSARAWLRKYDYKTPKMDKTANYLRYRQEDPKKFIKESLRTITFSKSKGIKAIVGIPKRRNNSFYDVNTTIVKGSGYNTFYPSKFDEYRKAMIEYGGWGNFPPIEGYDAEFDEDAWEDYKEAQDGGYEHELDYNQPMDRSMIGQTYVYVYDGHHRALVASSLGIPIRIKVTKNPRRRNGSTKLVPKEQVRMVGFDPKKTAIVQPEIKHVLKIIEELEGRHILFPSPIRPMTKKEFEHGRTVIDSGHPRGAGHGQYDVEKQEVAINGNMDPFDIIANIFHENLHHARPDYKEETVRDTTGDAMLYLYGEYNLGKPFADGRIKTNPRIRSNRKLAKKETRDSRGRLIPQKYLRGYKGKRLDQRIKEIDQRRKEYDRALKKYGDEDNFPKSTIKKLYRPFKTDKGIKSKKSSYTVEAKNRGFTGSIENKAKQASKYYGGKIPVSILKQVNKKGMAAWASGGHRAGQTSHSWGIARVNSFLVGGKTFFTADRKLAEQLPTKVRKAIEKERVYKG